MNSQVHDEDHEQINEVAQPADASEEQGQSVTQEMVDAAQTQAKSTWKVGSVRARSLPIIRSVSSAN